MKTMILLLSLTLSLAQAATPQVEQWGMFEVALEAQTSPNPFVGIDFDAVFTQGDESFTVPGFYDGEGVFKLRFMPNRVGTWSYVTRSNYEALNGKTGTLTCTPAGPDNHGPVGVRNQYHFGYADGTPYYPFGTTIYEWPFQSPEKQQQTLETLKSTSFNKARFLLIPPYRPEYCEGPHEIYDFPFVGTNKETFDFARFNPGYFRHLETCIQQLQDLGIEADVIIFRPYANPHWGMGEMDMATNERYLRYVIARLSAYRNVWWSMANENSFMEYLTDEDWDRLFHVVRDTDPYGHLRSIHNADRIYNHTHPWVTHVSLQYYMAVRFFGASPMLRDIYRKPIIHDEINYEGNISSRWGQLSSEEMVYRFWVGLIGGTYVTHGETNAGEDMGDGWISTGGTLKRLSPPRIAFLRQIVEEAPVDIDPIDQYFQTSLAGKAREYYLTYFGKESITEWPFILPKRGDLEDGLKFKVDVIDTWNMTITPLDEVFEIEKMGRYDFIDKDKKVISLPGKPYMALRIQRINP